MHPRETSPFTLARTTLMPWTLIGTNLSGPAHLTTYNGLTSGRRMCHSPHDSMLMTHDRHRFICPHGPMHAWDTPQYLQYSIWLLVGSGSPPHQLALPLLLISLGSSDTSTTTLQRGTGLHCAELTQAKTLLIGKVSLTGLNIT